jgi:hypothetical protein
MASLATHVHPKAPWQWMITGEKIRASFCCLYFYLDIVVTNDRKTSVNFHFLTLCIGCAGKQKND